MQGTASSVGTASPGAGSAPSERTGGPLERGCEDDDHLEVTMVMMVFLNFLISYPIPKW